MTPRVFDNTYQALKREVTNGSYPPGQRLQARALADRLGTSTTPITEAMRQLLGENVLEYTAQDGFIIPRVNLRRVHDLYYLNNWLTGRCLADIVANRATVSLIGNVTDQTEVLLMTERFMIALAAASQNSEVLRQVGNVNDRLRSCRLLETNLLDDTTAELNGLIGQWNNKDWEHLRADLSNYHIRRLDQIPQLVIGSYHMLD
jgi:DNA-binding GntR family transcriptional regulator